MVSFFACLEDMTPVETKMTPDEGRMTSDEEKMTSDNETKQKKSAEDILQFCLTPKGILEIADYLNLKEKKSTRRHIKLLLENGRLAMTLPDRPNSKNQKYITIK